MYSLQRTPPLKFLSQESGDNSGQNVSPHTQEKIQNESDISVGFYREQNLLFTLNFQDEVRGDSQHLLATLRRLGFQVRLLTGDSSSAGLSTARELGFESEEIKIGLSPEGKAQEISRYPHSLFVGDGLNDTLAFSAAQVGIATQGSLQQALQCADFFFAKCSLKEIVSLIRLGKKIRFLLNRNLVFALVYNFCVGLAALLGLVNPLVAALFMPVSSGLIFFLSLSSLKPEAKPKVLPDLNQDSKPDSRPGSRSDFRPASQSGDRSVLVAILSGLGDWVVRTRQRSLPRHRRPPCLLQRIISRGRWNQP